MPGGVPGGDRVTYLLGLCSATGVPAGHLGEGRVPRRVPQDPGAARPGSPRRSWRPGAARWAAGRRPSRQRGAAAGVKAPWWRHNVAFWPGRHHTCATCPRHRTGTTCVPAVSHTCHHVRLITTCTPVRPTRPGAQQCLAGDRTGRRVAGRAGGGGGRVTGAAVGPGESLSTCLR